VPTNPVAPTTATFIDFVLKKINNKILMPAAHTPLGDGGKK
jgi:hypothetical protein